MITVLGLGNVLIGDDAFGPHVVRMLDAMYAFDPEVTVLDAGTPGLDLVPHLLDTDALIVVDTVRTNADAGTVRVYRRDEIMRKPPSARVSPHDPGLRETLFTLELHGGAPYDVVLVGVVPANVQTGIGLSAVVRAAVPTAIAHVAAELTRLGHPPHERTAPGMPDLWWERSADAAQARLDA